MPFLRKVLCQFINSSDCDHMQISDSPSAHYRIFLVIKHIMSVYILYMPKRNICFI